MNRSGWLIIFAIGLSLSCERNSETISGDPTLTLEFSTDTVSFDTIFTADQSITQRFRVFNRNKEALNISSIGLQEGANSAFTLFINGIEGRSFTDVVLNGEDSLLVLVEVSIEEQNEDLAFKVADQIEFLTNGNLQQVLALAYGQDALRFGNEILPCDVVWTSDRPYLLSDTVLVDSPCNLTIEAGTRIFFEPGAIFFVAGNITVNGSASQKVVFSNSRKDFSDVPGQWRGIYFLEGSNSNSIDFAEIRNAEIGLRLGTPDMDTIPDLVLSNSVIENMSRSGLLCFNSDVYAYNTLINNCAEFTVGNVAGGSYRYEHCTFSSFGFDFFRNEPSTVFADNLVLPDNSLLVNDLYFKMENCIIWGILTEEIIFSETSGNNQLSLDYTLLRTEMLELDTGSMILNMDPMFVSPSEKNLRLIVGSPAINSGNQLGITEDLDGLVRDSLPDLGAYEYRPD